MDGFFAILAVTLVDYLFILLAVLGIGKLLEKPKLKLTLGIVSSLVLILFGLVMIFSFDQPGQISNLGNVLKSNYFSSFISAFLLTISSPLTIVFWTSLFATKAIEKGYEHKELIIFGIAAGSATLVFLGFSIALLTIVKTSIPIALLKTSNAAVGILLIIYGGWRLGRIAIPAKAVQRLKLIVLKKAAG